MEARNVRWILILWVGMNAWCGEFRYLHRSSKALMMGDAYTTLATEAATLFYNPALAARSGDFGIYPLPVDIQITDITREKERFDNADTSNIEEFANTFIGFPVHLAFGTIPTIKFKWLTFTPFATGSADIIIRDRVHPVVDLDYKYDKGFSLGLGFIPYGNSEKGESLAIGASIKHIKREGLTAFYDVFGVTIADIISSGSTELSELKDALGYSTGTGWGGDLGVDWRYQSKSSTFAVGFSALDITDTEFKSKGSLPDQKMSLNFGTSVTTKYNRWMNGTISFDLHPLSNDIDFTQKVHAGIRLGIPLFDFYAGYNGGQGSYGVVFSFLFLEAALGVYEKKIRQMKRRYLAAHVSLFNFAF